MDTFFSFFFYFSALNFNEKSLFGVRRIVTFLYV